MPRRARAFCFTINNPDGIHDNLHQYGDDAARLNANMQYIIYGAEIGTTGTPHLQGFVYFTNGRTINGIKSIDGFKRAHIEVCNDSSPGYKRAIDYCRKGSQSHDQWIEMGEAGPDFGKDAQVYQYGNAPQRQGARNDISRAIEILQSTNFDLSALARQEPEMYIRHYRGFDALRERLSTSVRDFKTKVVWIKGPTGVGKSRFIADLQRAGIDVYWKVNSIKWYNQYDSQPVMALDDYRKGGGYLLFNDMLRLFDRYPLQVEFKGGCSQFVSKYIIVTSCQSPTELWEGQTDERIDQLLRRIEHFIELPNAVSQLRLSAIRAEILSSCGIISEIPVGTTRTSSDTDNLTEIDGENEFNKRIRSDN